MIFAPGGDFIPAKNAGGELFMANIAPRASFFQEFLEFFYLGAFLLDTSAEFMCAGSLPKIIRLSESAAVFYSANNSTKKSVV